MRKLILLLVIAGLFFGCKKQAMEDVYADSFPDEEYPPSGLWGGDVKATDIAAFTGDSKTGFFQLVFGSYVDWNTGHVEPRFYVNRFVMRSGPDDWHNVIESAEYTFVKCKSNIVKIEKIFKIAKVDNSKWDDEILGYWVLYYTIDNVKKTKGRRMMRLDQQKYIDFK
jgi:hypothetical protein